MLRAYVGRAFDLEKGRILQVLGRLRGSELTASPNTAFADFASRAETLLRQEIIALGRDAGHVDTEQPVPYVIIFPDNDNVAAPAATGSLVAARISKQRPGPKPDNHLKFYRIIVETAGHSGQSNDGAPEILLDDGNLRRIVAAADSQNIKPPGRRTADSKSSPYPSWTVCLTTNKEACRKAIQNRIKWAMGQLAASSRVTG